MNETEHPQSRFGGVDVDAAMVPLLRQLWRRGIRTVGSCQSWGVLGGAAYVSFVTEQDYEAFKEIVESTSCVVAQIEPDRGLRERLRDPAVVEDVAAKYGCWALGFPPDDLRAVTAAAGRTPPAESTP